MNLWQRIFGKVALPAGNTTKIKRWAATFTCKACDHFLTEHTVYYSNGVCPYCGAVSEGTVVAVNKHSCEIEV